MIELFIPYIGPSTNSIYAGIHYRTRMKHAEDARKAAMVACRGVKPAQGKVDLVFTPRLGKGARMRDTSNYSYTVKLIEDGLVAAGILADDTQQHVATIITHPPVVDRKSATGMKVQLLPHNKKD